MIERLILSAAVTYSLNLFLGITVPSAPQSESELHQQPSRSQLATRQPSSEKPPVVVTGN